MYRLTSRIAGFLIACGVVLSGAAPASAQDDWPNRPITLMFPFAAGGGADFVARLIASGIEEELGVPIIVEARPGASGVIGTEYLVSSDPNGYLFMMSPAAPVVNAPVLRPDSVPYDAETDVDPVMKLVVSPIILLVNGDLPAENVQELVDLALANPGDIAIGNSGSGSTQQLLDYMFQGGTRTELNLISYDGTGEIVPDLLAGRLDIMLDFPSGYAGYFESGEVRMLASMSDERLPLFPDVPTVHESGFPDVPAWSGWFGLFAPAGVPDEIEEQFATAIRNYLSTEAAQERLAAGGYSVDTGSADDLRALMAREREVLTGIVEEYGLGQ